MALAGDEKKIRALFSELALQDQSVAPTFEQLWLNAASKNPAAPVRGLSRPLLVVTAALLIVAASWGAWSWYRTTIRSSHQQALNVSPQIVSAPLFQEAAQQPNQLTAAFKPRPSRPTRRRLHQPERPAIAEAALLSHWQSPTQLLMKSPAAVDLNSLPELNQSVEKLKQFLTGNTELTKESNQ